MIDTPGNQIRHFNLALLNVLIALVLPLFITIFGEPFDYVLGYVVGFLIMLIIDARYAGTVFWSLVFLLYLGWQIILSNISLAWLVLQPKPNLDPGIVAMPLRVKTGLEITLLASAITLTPGTLSVELKRDSKGQRKLYIHSLLVRDPERLRQSLRDGFERMILRITTGAMN